MEGGAAWDIGTKGAAKKRKTEKTESKSKKRKMEKLVGWGEVTDIESELNVRDWLVEAVGVKGGETEKSCSRFKEDDGMVGAQVEFKAGVG